MVDRRLAVTHGAADGFAGRLSLGLALMVGLVACSGSGSAPTQTPKTPTLQAIALSPGTSTLAVGLQQQFTVTGSYSDGTTAAVTSGLAWASSAPTFAAIDANGLARAAQSGLATITVTHTPSGLSAHATINVSTAALQSISVKADRASTPTHFQQQFSAFGTFSDGSTVLLRSVSWSSSNDVVASADPVFNGLVRSNAAGQATITATDPATGISGNAPLGVTVDTLQQITVSPDVASVAFGLNQQFTATGHFTDGSTCTLVSVTWTSSNAAIATVDSLGQAYGAIKGPATATITASDDSTGLSGNATLTVLGPALQLISVTPAFVSIPATLSKQLTVTGFYSDGSSANLTSSATWSSSNGAVTVVGGLVSGSTSGASAVVTATVNGTASALANITITDPITVAGIAPGQLPITDGLLDATGTARFKIDGLLASTDYLVKLGSADGTTLVQVHAVSTFDAPVGTGYAGPVPCRGGRTDALGTLYVLVSGAPGTTFTLDAAPLTASPVAVAGNVDRTETYYKFGGLGPSFTATLDGLTDDADLYVYDGPTGPFGANLICSSIKGRTASAGFNTPTSLLADSCAGAVPASGAIYVTVEGWLTGAGTPFTLSVN
jgi:hypothetical protein